MMLWRDLFSWKWIFPLCPGWWRQRRLSHILKKHYLPHIQASMEADWQECVAVGILETAAKKTEED